jgi:gamma-glutamyltranspeptidase/glutathione hydrolase
VRLPAAELRAPSPSARSWASWPDTRRRQLPLQDGLPSADWLHLYTEAARLAFADRASTWATRTSSPLRAGSWMSLLDAGLPGGARQLIGAWWPEMKSGKPGTRRRPHQLCADGRPDRIRHVAHQHRRRFQGQVLAMTTTIEDAFGARQMVRGFLLNNELTDFSFAPTDASGASRSPTGSSPASGRARRCRPRWCSTRPPASC